MCLKYYSQLAAYSNISPPTGILTSRPNLPRTTNLITFALPYPVAPYFKGLLRKVESPLTVKTLKVESTPPYL